MVVGGSHTGLIRGFPSLVTRRHCRTAPAINRPTAGYCQHRRGRADTAGSALGATTTAQSCRRPRALRATGCATQPGESPHQLARSTPLDQQSLPQGPGGHSRGTAHGARAEASEAVARAERSAAPATPPPPLGRGAQAYPKAIEPVSGSRGGFRRLPATSMASPTKP